MACFSLEKMTTPEFTSLGAASLSVLSIFSSAKRGEVGKGEWTDTTGDLLLISATTELSPLSNSNTGDTVSLAKCVGYCVSVISTAEDTT